jgi:glycosyltransferase involved in cell wall biosynthesis
VLAGPVWLLALGWIWQWARWVRNFPRVPVLAEIPLDELPPLRVASDFDLTVIVPACNEAAAIAATLDSLLASTGLRLQILAVNDRSTDATRQIMERVAAEAVRGGSAHRLQVISIAELPPGWLGKPHALATAAGLAQSEWILFTDGDVMFAPDALARALRFAQSELADHLAIMPDWLIETWGEAALYGALHALSCWTLRLWRIPDPKSRDFLGVGAFNLVRRSAYEDLGGFASLRMEVLEDLRLGWMVKRAGLRQRVAVGRGTVRVRWAVGAWGVVRNLEKNMFALYRYKIWLISVACMGLAVQIALPLAGLFAGGWALAGSLVCYAALAAMYWSSRRVTGVPARYFWVFPAAAGLFLVAMVRSVGLAIWRGGVVWRGTTYPLKELRAHAGRFW